MSNSVEKLSWIFTAVIRKATFSPIKRTSRGGWNTARFAFRDLRDQIFDSPGAGKHCDLMIHTPDESEARLLDRKRKPVEPSNSFCAFCFRLRGPTEKMLISPVPDIDPLLHSHWSKLPSSKSMFGGQFCAIANMLSQSRK